MCCLFLAASSTVAIAQTNVVDLVNPIIGTNGMGHTFPGACVPFGLVQLSPDTDTIPHNVDGKYQPRSYEYCAGYQHKDSSIVGFSHTHFSGTGHSDLGDILIMPTTGTLKLNPGTATNPDGGYQRIVLYANIGPKNFAVIVIDPVNHIKDNALVLTVRRVCVFVDAGPLGSG